MWPVFEKNMKIKWSKVSMQTTHKYRVFIFLVSLSNHLKMDPGVKIPPIATEYYIHSCGPTLICVLFYVDPIRWLRTHKDLAQNSDHTWQDVKPKCHILTLVWFWTDFGKQQCRISCSFWRQKYFRPSWRHSFQIGRSCWAATCIWIECKQVWLRWPFRIHLIRKYI